MLEPPATRPSLLVRLRDARDSDAWREFVELYAPLVYRYGRCHRLQDADAADLTQDVLRAVSVALQRQDYHKEGGSFRGWLFTLAHHKLCDLLTRQRRQAEGSGDSGTQELLAQLPAPEEDLWNQQYEQRLLAWAAEKARPEFTEATWQAFWLTAVEGQSATQVAQGLGLSVGAVYIAKSRVQARLKKLVGEARQE
jgi:RNA polymerase sigma-70 factor (ECF subfamily)